MDVISVVRKLGEDARQFGLGAAMHEVQCGALNKVIDFKILRGMTAVLDDIAPDLLTAPGYQARFASRDELLAAAATPEVAAEMTPAFVDRALAKGDECYALFDGDRLVSFGWYSNAPTRVSADLVLHFDPAWIYMYKGYTLKDYRGQRLHGIGMSLTLEAYTGRGRRGLISYVKSTNYRSLRSIARMGYRIFGDVYVARLRDRTWTWASPGCTRYQFEVRADQPAIATAPAT